MRCVTAARRSDGPHDWPLADGWVRRGGDRSPASGRASAGALTFGGAWPTWPARCQSWPRVVRVRIGLGTGESTIRDGDYFGMPSIEAARLCDQAPADGILVSPATKMLAGRVDGARFESVGELELKGIAEPVEAFRVMWEPLDPELARGGGRSPGRCPRPVGQPRVAYVGRAAERAMLDQRHADRRVLVRVSLCCCLVSRGSGRRGWQPMRRWARTRTGSVCAGGPARRISRRRMSRGSQCARS